MELHDTTAAANEAEDMSGYYMYHVSSPASRWSVAVEQPEQDRFNVQVLFREPAWDLSGVLRYWTYSDRTLAEARYIELQRILGGLPEDSDMAAIVSALPPEERTERGD
ncbi:MAG TPA: hypothetical protein V6D47_11465 [Oscillatoriaceae cyanobacterium]